MKKLMIAVAGLFLCGVVKAEVPDIIQKTLLEHVTTVTHLKNAETDVALVDSVVLIGNYKGRSIFDIQFGLSAKTNPDSNEASGGNFLVGGLFKVSSLLKDVVKFPEQWRFLNSIEHGVGYYYDTREKHGYGTYSIGLAFGLNPKG